MPKQATISVLPHQRKFIESKTMHTGLVGGYGSGKSHAGAQKTVIMKLRYPQYPVAYYLPTYGLIKDVAFKNFSEVLTNLGIDFEINRTDTEIITKYGKIICRSMDNPDRIVGYEVAYSLIDETDILPMDKMDEVYGRILGRNRCNLPDDEINKTDVVGTPEGFKWFYKYFVKEGNDNRTLIRAKTSDNKFLPDNYIDTLKDTYTVEQLAAYLDGEFINLSSGTVLHNFDRVLNHTSKTDKGHNVIHIGMDFNITHMAGIAHIIENDKPYAVSEFYDIYDTAAMIQAIKERYPTQTIAVYPDAAGQARSTSGLSDVKLLTDAKFIVKVPKKNPPVKDRITIANMLFCNNKEERNYKVNTDNCPHYTESLEQLAYKNGVPDKSTGHDHIIDAGTYFIYRRFNSKPKRRGQR